MERLKEKKSNTLIFFPRKKTEVRGHYILKKPTDVHRRPYSFIIVKLHQSEILPY